MMMLTSHKSVNALFIISDLGRHSNTYCPFPLISACCGGCGGLVWGGWGYSNTGREKQSDGIHNHRRSQGEHCAMTIGKISAQLSIDHAFLLPWLPPLLA